MKWKNDNSESGQRTADRRRGRRLLFRAEGSQLVEFALVLPILLVLTVGGADFGRAYNLKQKLANGAREGVRIAVGQSQADLSQTAPATVQGVRNAVVAYLQSENLDTSFISDVPSKTGAREWTYSSTATSEAILIIDRGAVIPVTVDGVTMLAVSTRITLRYPFAWSFPQILRPCPEGSSGCSDRFLISTEVIMRNLT